MLTRLPRQPRVHGAEPPLRHRETSPQQIEGAAKVNADDISIAVRDWNGDAVGAEGGAIAIVVRFPAQMQIVLCTKLREGENVIKRLRAAVDSALKLDF
jgi:hypothetical protein